MSEAKQKENAENKEKLICCRCNKELVPTQTFFDYLGHNFPWSRDVWRKSNRNWRTNKWKSYGKPEASAPSA